MARLVMAFKQVGIQCANIRSSFVSSFSHAAFKTATIEHAVTSEIDDTHAAFAESLDHLIAIDESADERFRSHSVT